MFQFIWIWLLLILPLPFIVARFLPPAKEADSQALKVPFYSAIADQQIVSIGGSGNKYRWFSLLIWLLLVLAAARPQWIGEAIAIPVSGRDLMLAVDVSASMREQDLAGDRRNRLDVIKQVGGEFIQRREGDRVGLILFGTQAYLQTPLTLDRTTVTNLLNESAIGIAGKRTAIGDAIGLAVKRLRDRNAPYRVLILMTDGANTAGVLSPDRAANIAKSENVTIHTIGVGGDGPSTGGFFGLNFNRSSELDEKTLYQIASMTGGQYFRARDSKGLEEIYRTLDKLEPVVAEDKQLRPVRELFVWPLGLALMICAALVTLNFLLSRRSSIKKSSDHVAEQA